MSEPDSFVRRVGNRGDEPWLGLESYAESDKDLFFGREKETAELLRLLKREVLTIVFGPSGTGKTSLLNAGLFPRLRDEYFLPIPIRLDHSTANGTISAQVRAAVGQVLAAYEIEEEFRAEAPSGEDETLWEYLNRVELWDKRNNAITPVLVFDQFEEIFTIGGNRPSINTFISDLSAVVENYIPAPVRARLERSGDKPHVPEAGQHYKVLLALREDFVSRLDGLRVAMPSVMHNRVLLAHMNGEQALRPVLLPGRALVSEEVADKIVRKVSGEQEPERLALHDLLVEPALLSLMCTELNTLRIRDGKETITEDLVDNAAGDILSHFYERSLSGLAPGTRMFVEDRLLTAEGFRTTAALDSAIRGGLGNDVSILIDRRLLRCEERLGLPHLELTHDVLTKVVKKSRDERQEREARETEKCRVLKREMDRKKELTSARRLLAIVSSAALVCLALGVLASIFYLRARNERQRAFDARNEGIAKRLAIQVQRLQQTNRDDDLSYLLLKAAASINPAEPLLGDAGFSVATQPYSVQALPSGLEQLADVKLSPDAHLVAAAGQGDYIFVWRDNNTSERRPPCPSQSCTAVAWSPDSQRIAFGENDGSVNVWDFKANQLIVRQRAHGARVMSLAWKSNTELASAGLDGRALMWDLDRDHPALLPPVARSLYALAFSPDGRLAIGGYRALKVWDPARKTFLLSFTPKNIISSVAWSSGGDLAAGGWDGNVRVFDANLHQRPTYTLPSQRRVYAVAWLSGNKSVVIGSNDQNIAIWDVDSKQRPLQLTGAAGTTKAVAAEPGRRRFAQIADDQYIRVWTESPNPSLLTLADQEAETTALNWSESNRVILAGAKDGRVVAWNTSEPDDAPAILAGPLMPINDLLSLDADALTLLGIGGWQDKTRRDRRQGGLAFWRPGSRLKHLATLDWSGAKPQSFAPYLTRMALSPDGSSLVFFE